MNQKSVFIKNQNGSNLKSWPTQDNSDGSLIIVSPSESLWELPVTFVDMHPMKSMGWLHTAWVHFSWKNSELGVHCEPQ